jgi:hypothetical protein
MGILSVLSGATMGESASIPSAEPGFLDLKFNWNGQSAIGARGIVYGMEYPNVEYAEGMAPPYEGIEVVELSPFPYRFPKSMHAKRINAYLDPPLSIAAGSLKISITWSASPTAFQDWIENGVYPFESEAGDSAKIEGRMESWTDDLSGATPVKLRVQALSVTRNFRGVDTKFESVQVGKSVLAKEGAAEFELALSPMMADEEWIELEFPEFSISIERPKSKPLLKWLSPRMKAAIADAESKSRAPAANLKDKPSGKRPFWQFWKRGE